MTRVLVPDDMVGAAWGPGAEVVPYDRADASALYDDAAEVLVAGYGPHGEVLELADRLPKLRYLQTTYAGVETWQERLRPGILLGNTREAFARVTAELAVGGLLALLRGLPRVVAQQREHRWEVVWGETVWQRRVVVVGAGGVGTRVGEALTALGADIVTVARTARPGVHAVGALTSLLPGASVLVLTVPLTPETRHLVGAAELAALPDGAVVVNVARGAVVDPEALRSELVAGRLRAFLDVTDPEPLPLDDPIWDLPGVLVTPHVGGAVPAGVAAGIAEAAVQVASYCGGRLPANLVHRPPHDGTHPTPRRFA